MSEALTIHKVIQDVPTEEVVPNGIYFVRRGAGFDIRVADMLGETLHNLNSTSSTSLYDSAGLISAHVKIWRGTVVATKGIWEVDFTSAGFIAPPYVMATAEAFTGDKAENANFAAVEFPATTTTYARGRAQNAVTAGLLVGMVNTNANCNIQIIAIGV